MKQCPYCAEDQSGWRCVSQGQRQDPSQSPVVEVLGAMIYGVLPFFNG